MALPAAVPPAAALPAVALQAGVLPAVDHLTAVKIHRLTRAAAVAAVLPPAAPQVLLPQRAQWDSLRYLWKAAVVPAAIRRAR